MWKTSDKECTYCGNYITIYNTSDLADASLKQSICYNCAHAKTTLGERIVTEPKDLLIDYERDNTPMNFRNFEDTAFKRLEKETVSDVEVGINPKDLIGAKKINMALLPTAGKIKVAQCMEDGAHKYGPFNWRDVNKKVGYMTYLAAAERHLDAFKDGEDLTRDSKLCHLASICAGLMVLIDAIECGTAIDNRPIKGKAGDLLA